MLSDHQVGIRLEGRMGKITEILVFRRMIAPVLLQLLFWAGVIGCLYGAYVLYKLGNWAWIFSAFLGPLLVRVIFEHAILSFKTFEELRGIRDLIERKGTPD